MRTAITDSLCALMLFTPLAVEAATVLSVGDGDTLRIVEGEQRITIRVACIDAPEIAQSPPRVSRLETLSKFSSLSAPQSR